MDINDKQRTVLAWIGNGCPDDVFIGYDHRVSAAALRSRGLLRTVGRGPRWRAELTDSGRQLLERLHDEPEKPRRSVPARRLTNGDPAGPVSKTEQLIQDVIDAGGMLVRPDEMATGGVDWRQRAYAAQRHGKVPEGKHLAVERTKSSFRITLRDGVTGNELGADPVPVPSRPRKLHPAVLDFRDASSTHLVSRRALARAVRIMEGLAKALALSGFTVQYSTAEDDYSRSQRHNIRSGRSRS